MTTVSYRIYLAPNCLGRLQQINRSTRDFYDVLPHFYLDADHTRWYRVSSTSRGRTFTALWKAAPADITDYITVTELGARMRLFCNQWYVDSQDIDLSKAVNPRRLVLSWPKALALAMALLVFIYLAGITLYSIWTGQLVPPFQPLARFSAAAMLLLLSAEQLLGRLERWMQESLGVW
jgi:hypothetical protein